MVYIEEMDRTASPAVELTVIDWSKIRQGLVYGSLKSVYLRIRLKERTTNSRKLVL